MIILLFAIFTAPDGSRTVHDVAIVASENACETIASELNASPRKPAEVAFGCRATRVEKA